MASCTCNKCGRTMDEKQFYTYHDGTKTELCKKCLTMHVDCFDPDTFTWILEKMDVPYIPSEWNALRTKVYEKDPNKSTNNTSVLGKYLSKMKLNQWKNARWADSERLIAEEELKKEKEKKVKEGYERELQKQLQEGEIDKSQYNTLTSVEFRHSAEAPPIAPKADGNVSRFFNENDYISTDELVDPAADLTQEDKVYLAMKWGRLYKPHEWIELEKKYTEMMNSFDIQDSDTIGTLILTCKTYLKMNQAIDCGDFEGFQKLSRVYDSMRKSSKFTAAQNKVESNDFVDSVGQMVAYCEREGGKIPQYKISADLDIVDKIINDLKSYTKSLIYEDTALSQQIEDYLKKKEIAEAMKKDKQEAKSKGLDTVEIDEDDIKEHYERIEEEKLKDKKIMYGEFNL